MHCYLSLQVSSGAMSLSSHDVNDHVENQHRASPVPSHMATEVPLSGNMFGTQPSLGSERLQHPGVQMGLPTQWQGVSHQQDTSSSKPYRLSSNLFRTPESASSSIGNSSASRNEEQYQNSQQEYSAKQYSGNSAGHQTKKESSINDEVTDVNSSPPLNNNIQKQEYLREHDPEIGAIRSGSLITDDGKSFPHKNDDVYYQHRSELSLSGQNSVNKDIEKSDLNAVSSIGAFSSGVNKGEDQGEQSSKALLHEQNMLSQDSILAHSVGNNKTSNVTYSSQISLPMVQSWFKQYETLKNQQRLPIYDPSAAIHATQPSSEMTPGSMQDSSLNTQISAGNASQGSGSHSSTAVAPALHKQLNPSSVMPSGVTHQNLTVVLGKKRKLVAFEMVPWYKEVKHDQGMPQDIRSVGLSNAIGSFFSFFCFCFRQQALP